MGLQKLKDRDSFVCFTSGIEPGFSGLQKLKDRDSFVCFTSGIEPGFSEVTET